MFIKAGTLPFKELTMPVEFKGDQCDFNNHDREDPHSWLLIQAQNHITIPKKDSYGGQVYLSINPTRVIAFTTWPGEGCEGANFGLCQYPTTVEFDGKVHRTKLPAWSWHSFCKTCYSDDFERCHYMVCAMLRLIEGLPLDVEVSDEGDYYQRDDIDGLIADTLKISPEVKNLS
tara:strand:- start:164 stop:685 length:522 start_codon:yes stop_codon:yes gene_type:complete